MQTLIAEDLLLLLLDDERGTLAASDKVQPLLGGALLLELAIAGRVEVSERSSRWSTAKVVAVGTPLGEPVLDAAMARVAEKPRTAQDLVARLGKGTKEVLLDRLAARGLVERRDGKVLGLFPHTTWPARDARHEESVRALLQGVLVQGLTPDQRTSALVALLSAIDHAHKVVDRGDVPVREVKARAKAIADGAWAAKAVKDAVAAAQAAIAAAVTASIAATTASSG
ncbi:GOLPH3/VPS74 family protein [Nocardioides sp. P5_C9_2]